MPGEDFVMNPPARHVGGDRHRLDFFGEVTQDYIELIGFEETFSSVVHLELRDVRLAGGLSRTYC